MLVNDNACVCRLLRWIVSCLMGNDTNFNTTTSSSSLSLSRLLLLLVLYLSMDPACIKYLIGRHGNNYKSLWYGFRRNVSLVSLLSSTSLPRFGSSHHYRSDPIRFNPILSNPTQSNSILSQQNIECNIIYNSLFINDGGGCCIYIYICWYYSFVILLMFFLPYRYSMVYTINYILYGRRMGTVQHIVSFLLPLLLLLIVIYDGVGTYNETVIIDWGLVCWWWCVYGHVLVHPFPQGKLLHYYSKHISSIRWFCWLFYMMISCWYGWLGTRMTV